MIIRITEHSFLSQSKHEALLTVLNNLHDTDITFQISSHGGRLYMLIDLWDMLSTSQGSTSATVIFAESAAAMLAVSCDTIKATSYSHLMFHRVRAGISGELVDDYACPEMILYTRNFNLFVKPYLDSTELSRYNQGENVYMSVYEYLRRRDNVVLETA